MPIRQSSLIRGLGVTIGTSIYLTTGLGDDITFRGQRLLIAGKQETNTSLFDTNIFPGGVAGSLTPSKKGDTDRYVRIS